MTAVSQVPVAANDTYATNEDTPLTVTTTATGILANDSDPQGDALTVQAPSVTQPAHGTVTVNANGTLTLLEATRKYCPNAVFIFTSTNKVYGDTPNTLPLVELDTRWEIDPTHPFYQGIDESMSIDTSLHSLFGASKVAADVMVQEYGRYFGMRTVCFRGGCLTGPNHSGTALHGFLSYLMKCVYLNKPYTIYGYKGKQVRETSTAPTWWLRSSSFTRPPRRVGCPVARSTTWAVRALATARCWKLSSFARK